MQDCTYVPTKKCNVDYHLKNSVKFSWIYGPWCQRLLLIVIQKTFGHFMNKMTEINKKN